MGNRNCKRIPNSTLATVSEVDDSKVIFYNIFEVEKDFDNFYSHEKISQRKKFASRAAGAAKNRLSDVIAFARKDFVRDSLWSRISATLRNTSKFVAPLSAEQLSAFETLAFRINAIFLDSNVQGLLTCLENRTYQVEHIREFKKLFENTTGSKRKISSTVPSSDTSQLPLMDFLYSIKDLRVVKIRRDGELHIFIFSRLDRDISMQLIFRNLYNSKKSQASEGGLAKEGSNSNLSKNSQSLEVALNSCMEHEVELYL